MRNFIFLVAAQQMKLLRLKLFKLNETTILQVENFKKIAALYTRTLGFLSNADEFFNYHVSSLFLYFMIDETSMVRLNSEKNWEYYPDTLRIPQNLNISLFQFFFVYASLTFLQTNLLDVIANSVTFAYEFLVILITIFSTKAAKRESLEIMKLIRNLRLTGAFKREVIFCL
jgi:hypothetical protein